MGLGLGLGLGLGSGLGLGLGSRPSCVMPARCLVSGGPGIGLPRKDILNADLRNRRTHVKWATERGREREIYYEQG